MNIDYRCKLSLLHTYVISALLYGSEAWDASFVDLSKLKLFQNRILKWAVNGEDYLHRLRRASFLPISPEIQFMDLLLLNKLINSKFDFPIWDCVFS